MVHWSRLEPERGRIDEAHLDEIDAYVTEIADSTMEDGPLAELSALVSRRRIRRKRPETTEEKEERAKEQMRQRRL